MLLPRKAQRLGVVAVVMVTVEDSETLESANRTSAQARPCEQETDPTVLPSAISGLTCADEKVDLSTLDLDDIDAVDTVTGGTHRTHCSSSKEEDIHSGSEDEGFSYGLLRYVLCILCMLLQKNNGCGFFC